MSLLVTAVVAVAVIQDLPDGAVKTRLSGIQPYATAVGLDQRWSMFAPDPYRIKVHVDAEIRYRDGSRRSWPIPHGGPLVGAYWDFRWRKYEEELRQNQYGPLWRPAAEYVARRERRRGRHPVTTTLVRRWYDLFPPGPGPDRGPWQHFAFFTFDVPPEAS